MTACATAPRLATPDVALHVADLAALAADRAAFEAEASPDERARAAGYRLPADRVRFVLRRGALRRLLAAATGRSPREVRLVAGYGGKPRLADEGPCFSSSSTGDLLVVAVSASQEVGVDVARATARADLDEVARALFPPAVRARLAALDPAAREEAFLRVWTLEEAVGKLDGRGIAEGPPVEDVPLDALVRDGLRALHPGADGRPRRVETVALDGGAVLSLATAPRDDAGQRRSVRS